MERIGNVLGDVLDLTKRVAVCQWLENDSWLPVGTLFPLSALYPLSNEILMNVALTQNIIVIGEKFPIKYRNYSFKLYI